MSFLILYIESGVDFRGGERGGCLGSLFFRDAVRAPLLRVSHLAFALFC